MTGRSSDSGAQRFASLLRQYRLAASLSQEALAEQSGLSARGVSNLERGISRAPYPSTVGRLADALGLTRAERAELAAAGRTTPAGQNTPVATADASTRLDPLGPAGVLPRERNGFIGRAWELGEVKRLLSEAPLVTLAGPGGAGKTRLALHLAQQLVQDSESGFRDGVRLIELAPVADASLVPRAVAAALGVAEQHGRPLLETLWEVLRTQHVLLVLDNCEHLVQACAGLAERVLDTCPDVRLLATSREPLEVQGEVVWRVQPLALPEDDGLAALGRSEAVQLFVQRAQAVRSDFVLSTANAAAVGHICRRVDGLPLAIELAAARVAALSPADIAARLETALSVPGGARTAPPRQQTIEAAVAWSYNLLDNDERLLFDRLSVFSGGFALEGAEALAEDTDARAAFETLSRLVAKSLVQVEPRDDGSLRYRLLEPLRQFGLRRLVERGELDIARRIHARHIVAIAEHASPGLHGSEMIGLFAQLDAEWDNIRVVHRWAQEAGAAELGLRLGAALWWWWSRPDRQAEGRGWLELALSVPDVEQHTRLRGRVVGGLAWLAVAQSDMSAAAELVDEVVRLAEATDDAWLYGIASLVLGSFRLFQGDRDGAEAALLDGLTRAQRAGLAWFEARNLDTLGHVALARGDPNAAEQRFRASLGLARGGLDPWSQAMALNGLADVLRSRGLVEQADSAYHEAQALLSAIDPRRRSLHGYLHNLGYLALGRGQLAEAARLFLESADGYLAVGTDRRGLAECVMGLASVAVRAERPAFAARLFGTAEATLDQLGTTLSASNQADYARGLAELRAQLPAHQLAEAWTGGRELALEDALAEARRLLEWRVRQPEETRARRSTARSEVREL